MDASLIARFGLGATQANRPGFMGLAVNLPDNLRQTYKYCESRIAVCERKSTSCRSPLFFLIFRLLLCFIAWNVFCAIAKFTL